MRVLDWFKEHRVKGETRYDDPGLLAFYWDGSSAGGKRVKDVSMTGAYLLTEERWYPGTILEVTLKREEKDSNHGVAPHFGLLCQVLRSEQDGIAVRFLANGRRKMLERFIRDTIASRRAEEAPQRASGANGQALVEFALTVPLLFLLMVNAVNFGGWLYSWITVGNAARAGADYAALSGDSVDYPATPTAANVVSLVQSETSALPHWSSTNPTVTVCQKYIAAVNLLHSTSACPAGVTAPPDDPEPTFYVILAVDVTYTYTPFIPLFPYATIPASTIHRRAVMRVL